MTSELLDHPPEALSRARRRTILLVCAGAMFLVGLDTTVVNVALPRIGSALEVSTSALQWTVDAYTIVFAGLLITAGATADRIGRRRVFRCGLVVLAVASLGCAVAPNLPVLLAARALQGVGASMLSPVALGIVVNATPDPAERARAIGVWASVFGLSTAVGPVLGGALTSAFGWRSVFWVVAAVAVLILVGVSVVVPESRGSRTRRPDPLGQLLLMLLLAGGVGLLIEAPRVGWFSPTVGAGAAGVLLLVLGLGFLESRLAEPVIEPSLFRVASFTGAVLGAVAVFVALSTVLFLIAVHLQTGQGASPMVAGSMIVPLAVAATVVAPVAGRWTARSGARAPLVAAGCFITAAGAWLLAAGSAPGTVTLLAAGAVFGVGLGFANAPITTTAVSGLPAQRAGVAAGITSSARQVGNALGVALAGGWVGEGASVAATGAALRPGWILVTGCGVLVLVVAATVGVGRARVAPVRADPMRS